MNLAEVNQWAFSWISQGVFLKQIFEVWPDKKSNPHGGEDKHDSKVDCNDGLEEEGLEVDGDVAHHVEQDRWQVDCQDAA